MKIGKTIKRQKEGIMNEKKHAGLQIFNISFFNKAKKRNFAFSKITVQQQITQKQFS